LQVRAESEQQHASDENDAPHGRLNRSTATVSDQHSVDTERKAPYAAEQVQRHAALRPVNAGYFLTLTGC
jgi:hypothetical protein